MLATRVSLGTEVGGSSAFQGHSGRQEKREDWEVAGGVEGPAPHVSLCRLTSHLTTHGAGGGGSQR